MVTTYLTKKQRNNVTPLKAVGKTETSPTLTAKKLYFGQCWSPHTRTLPSFSLGGFLKFKFLLDYQRLPFLTGYQTLKTVCLDFLTKDSS